MSTKDNDLTYKPPTKGEKASARGPESGPGSGDTKRDIEALADAVMEARDFARHHNGLAWRDEWPRTAFALDLLIEFYADNVTPEV